MCVRMYVLSLTQKYICMSGNEEHTYICKSWNKRVCSKPKAANWIWHNYSSLSFMAKHDIAS